MQVAGEQVSKMNFCLIYRRVLFLNKLFTETDQSETSSNETAYAKITLSPIKTEDNFLRIF